MAWCLEYHFAKDLFVLFILLPKTEHQRVYLSSFSFQKATPGTFTSSKRSILLHPSVAVHV